MTEILFGIFPKCQREKRGFVCISFNVDSTFREKERKRSETGEREKEKMKKNFQNELL